MNKFLALLFSLLVLPACSALASAIPVINSALTDTTLVLKGIETVFNAYQTAHPVDPETRAEYDKLLATAYQDLTFGERKLADLKDINQGDYDAAFHDFAQDFTALTAYLKSKGITPVGSGLVGAGQAGGDDFPVPRLIGLKIQAS